MNSGGLPVRIGNGAVVALASGLNGKRRSTRSARTAV